MHFLKIKLVIINFATVMIYLQFGFLKVVANLDFHVYNDL